MRFSRRLFAAALAATVLAGGQTAEAAMFRTFSGFHPMMASTFQPSISRWTALHTEAPSHFAAPLSENRFFAPTAPSHFSTFNGPTAGPGGAQFGRLPTNNNSFVDPTHNSFQAHQTRNSVQAQNTRMSSQAVQGRNCYYNAILAGLCQGR